MSKHHTDERVCELCEEKLLTAHEYLQSWFRAVKFRYPNVHVSWAYRGAADQEKAYMERKSLLHFPHSLHNHEQDGKPCSLALDLFQIDEDGVARWSPAFFRTLNAENERAGEPIAWGGAWKKYSDADHFQYAPKKTPV